MEKPQDIEISIDEEDNESEFSYITNEEDELESDEKEATDIIKNPFQGPSLSVLYKTVECISSGSPCSVFIVKARENGKYFALKKIECHDESDAKQVFYEEMELKKLVHQQISSYKEFFITYEKEGSTVFVNIISQYFPEGNLRKFIKEYQDKQEVVPEQVVKKILGELLEALVYLHDKGYLHRNIKPNNIFQSNGAMILSDMGVSSIMGDVRTNTRQTLQGTVFFAPEIEQGHNMKTDLYSMGGVLLNILTTSILSEQTFYKKLSEIKETPELLNEILDEISNKYSKPMINLAQIFLRHKHTNRPCTLELIKSGFVQECMAQADGGQNEIRSWQKKIGPKKIYHLTDNRDDVRQVLEYIADTTEDEELVADGLSALADILRDNEKAHEFIDQNARNMISLVMWNNIFHKDIQIAGCNILSNLAVFAKPNDVIFTNEVITIIHKIMAGHEYSPEVQLAAVNLILALSADSKASKSIVQLGGIHDILNAMSHARYNATLNAMCCMALWSLSIDSENLKIAVKENAAKDVCLALSVHKVSPDVCEAAAAALVSLLLDDGCYDLFSELDCCGNLIAAIYLHSKSERVVHSCCKVLAIAIEANEDFAYRFISTDKEEDDFPTGIMAVLKVYKEHNNNADVVESIVKLLLELSQYDDITAEMQAANVGPLLLSEVYSRYKQNQDIMRPVQKALERLEGPGIISKQRSHTNVSIQAVLPNRPYKFQGEVQQSCQAMLQRWHGTGQKHKPVQPALKSKK